MAIEELEAKAAEVGAKVASLKKGGGDKDAIDAAVAELLDAKAKVKAALEEAIASCKDEARLAVLQEKLAAATPRQTPAPTPRATP